MFGVQAPSKADDEISLLRKTLAISDVVHAELALA
jgi:hypothetical protein